MISINKIQMNSLLELASESKIGKLNESERKILNALTIAFKNGEDAFYINENKFCKILEQLELKSNSTTFEKLRKTFQNDLDPDENNTHLPLKQFFLKKTSESSILDIVKTQKTVGDAQVITSNKKFSENKLRSIFKRELKVISKDPSYLKAPILSGKKKKVTL